MLDCCSWGLLCAAAPHRLPAAASVWLPLPTPCSDYCEGLHDTLDLVVVGAWHGNGRKAVRALMGVGQQADSAPRGAAALLS